MKGLKGKSSEDSRAEKKSGKRERGEIRGKKDEVNGKNRFKEKVKGRKINPLI